MKIMSEIDYAIAILDALAPVHAEIKTSEENIEFWRALKYIGKHAENVLQIEHERFINNQTRRN